MPHKLWGFPFLLVINREHVQPSVDTMYYSFTFFWIVLPQPWIVSSSMCSGLYFAEYLRVTRSPHSVCGFFLSNTLVANSCCLGLSSFSAHLLNWGGLLGYPGFPFSEPRPGNFLKAASWAIIRFILFVSYHSGVTDFCYLISAVFKIIVSYMSFSFWGVGWGWGLFQERRRSEFLHLDWKKKWRICTVALIEEIKITVWWHQCYIYLS